MLFVELVVAQLQLVLLPVMKVVLHVILQEIVHLVFLENLLTLMEHAILVIIHNALLVMYPMTHAWYLVILDVKLAILQQFVLLVQQATILKQIKLV